MKQENNTSSTRLAWMMLSLNILATFLLIGSIWYLRGEGLKLDERYTTLQTAKREAGEQEAASGLLTETITERALLARSIITEGNLPTFIETLERIARASGTELDLTQATPSSETNPNITLAFSLAGSRAAVMRFVQLLDTLPIQMRIQHAQFQLANKGDEKNKGVWEANYYLELLSYGI